MATSGGIWAPIAVRAFKAVFKKTANLVEARIAQISKPLEQELQPILIRAAPRKPIHPVARVRQGQGRWYTTHSTINAAVRRFISTAPARTIKYDRASFPSSSTATAVGRLTTRAPFFSTLRPNLTGGALPRTAGGYSTGGGRAGGARYFSHTPAAPAQVVNNVSMAVRAFWLSGQKAQFDGVSPAGEKRYRSVSSLQESTTQKLQSISKIAPGSFIDFHVNPTVTALSPLGAAFPYKTLEQPIPSLNTEGLLDVLSTDFSRALKDLAVTMNDLKKLSALGDLPIAMEGSSTLRVRFPGCDVESVERLCDEVGVQRGVIHQDVDFDISVGGRIALLFPFAPSSANTISSPGGSLRSFDDFDFEAADEFDNNPWLSSPEGYESVEELSETESEYFAKPSEQQTSSEFEGLEGVYRFLEICDNVRRP